MAPELFSTMEANELLGLGQKIREWQLSRKPALSDNGLVKKFAGLGSTKTYKRVLENDLAELDLETQLANYRAVWAFIEGVGDDEGEAEEIYEDLYAVIQLRRCFTEASREVGLARCIFLLGPSGSGKTGAQRWLINKYGPRLVPLRASVAWNDSPMAMLGAILDALGIKDKPAVQYERLSRVVEELRKTRRCLSLEDAHHLGTRCLGLLIYLIDESPGEVIVGAVDTLWERLETKAFRECRQLTGNRMAERINLGREVREPDVRKLLERRLGWGKEESSKVMRMLCDKADGHGRLAFVRETIKRAQSMAGKDPVTLEAFTTAIGEEVASR